MGPPELSRLDFENWPWPAHRLAVRLAADIRNIRGGPPFSRREGTHRISRTIFEKGNVCSTQPLRPRGGVGSLDRIARRGPGWGRGQSGAPLPFSPLSLT